MRLPMRSTRKTRTNVSCSKRTTPSRPVAVLRVCHPGHARPGRDLWQAPRGPACSNLKACVRRLALDRQFQADAPMRPIRNGWLTSPTSGRPRSGCMRLRLLNLPSGSFSLGCAKGFIWVDVPELGPAHARTVELTASLQLGPPVQRDRRARAYVQTQLVKKQPFDASQPGLAASLQ